jgi:hypothetical protein
MPVVAAALNARGVLFELHRDNFAHDAPDEEWLPVVGERGWVILTRDAAMRHISMERGALEAVGARQFVVRGGHLAGAQIVAILGAAWNRIDQLAHRGGGGFIAHVTKSGVKVVLEFDRAKQRAGGSR